MHFRELFNVNIYKYVWVCWCFHRFSRVGITEFEHIHMHINLDVLLLLILFGHFQHKVVDCQWQTNAYVLHTPHENPFLANVYGFALRFASYCICHTSCNEKNAKLSKRQKHTSFAKVKKERVLWALILVELFIVAFLTEIMKKSDRKMQQIAM